MFADALPGGQSFGKMFVGIAVVDAESLQPCTALQAVGRNRVVTECLGLVWMLMEAMGRRRPSWRTETIVVRRKALADVRRDRAPRG
jgi:uncharacterized RDD family membrane protein YckC